MAAIPIVSRKSFAVIEDRNSHPIPCIRKWPVETPYRKGTRIQIDMVACPPLEDSLASDKIEFADSHVHNEPSLQTPAFLEVCNIHQLGFLDDVHGSFSIANYEKFVHVEWNQGIRGIVSLCYFHRTVEHDCVSRRILWMIRSENSRQVCGLVRFEHSEVTGVLILDQTSSTPDQLLADEN